MWTTVAGTVKQRTTGRPRPRPSLGSRSSSSAHRRRAAPASNSNSDSGTATRHALHPAEAWFSDSARDLHRRARGIVRLPSRKAASAPAPPFTEFAKMLSRTTVKEPLRGLRHRVCPPWSCLEQLPIAGNPVNAAFDAPFPDGKGSASRRAQGHGNRTCSRHAEYGGITLGQMQRANQRPAGPVTRLLNTRHNGKRQHRCRPGYRALLTPGALCAHRS